MDDHSSVWFDVDDIGLLYLFVSFYGWEKNYPPIKKLPLSEKKMEKGHLLAHTLRPGTQHLAF